MLPKDKDHLHGVIHAWTIPEYFLYFYFQSPHATIDYLNKVVVRLLPLPEPMLNRILEVLLSHLTHHCICLEPSGVSWKSTHWLELYQPTPIDLINFFKSLLQMNQRSMSQNTLPTSH